MHLSDGEKLILVMLGEMHKALNIKGGIDPDFVLETISRDYLWGFRYGLGGIPFSKGETPPEVRETIDALGMWWDIERSYEQLSNSDKKKIEKEADPFGKHVRFEGFDGNNEPHCGIARYFVEKLDMF